MTIEISEAAGGKGAGGKRHSRASINQSINQLFYLQTQMYHNGHMQYRDP